MEQPIVHASSPVNTKKSMRLDGMNVALVFGSNYVYVIDQL